MRAWALAAAVLSAACAHAPAPPSEPPLTPFEEEVDAACRRAARAKLEGVQPQQADVYAASGCDCLVRRLRASSFGPRVRAARGADDGARLAADFVASPEGAAAMRDCRDAGASASGLGR